MKVSDVVNALDEIWLSDDILAFRVKLLKVESPIFILACDLRNSVSITRRSSEREKEVYQARRNGSRQEQGNLKFKKYDHVIRHQSREENGFRRRIDRKGSRGGRLHRLVQPTLVESKLNQPRRKSGLVREQHRLSKVQSENPWNSRPRGTCNHRAHPTGIVP